MDLFFLVPLFTIIFKHIRTAEKVLMVVWGDLFR